MRRKEKAKKDEFLPRHIVSFALYRTQSNSPRADRRFARLIEALPLSSLVLLEFRQAIRLQMALYRQDRTKGFTLQEGDRIFAKIESHFAAGALRLIPVEWVDVHATAERLSELHITSGRHRLMDILHVATCLHLGATEFLTFDENQKRLAQAEGLKVTL